MDIEELNSFDLSIDESGGDKGDSGAVGGDAAARTAVAASGGPVTGAPTTTVADKAVPAASAPGPGNAGSIAGAPAAASSSSSSSVVAAGQSGGNGSSAVANAMVARAADAAKKKVFLQPHDPRDGFASLMGVDEALLARPQQAASTSSAAASRNNASSNGGEKRNTSKEKKAVVPVDDEFMLDDDDDDDDDDDSLSFDDEDSGVLKFSVKKKTTQKSAQATYGSDVKPLWTHKKTAPSQRLRGQRSAPGQSVARLTSSSHGSSGKRAAATADDLAAAEAAKMFGSLDAFIAGGDGGGGRPKSRRLQAREEQERRELELMAAERAQREAERMQARRFQSFSSSRRRREQSPERIKVEQMAEKDASALMVAQSRLLEPQETRRRLMNNIDFIEAAYFFTQFAGAIGISAEDVAGGGVGPDDPLYDELLDDERAQMNTETLLSWFVTDHMCLSPDNDGYHNLVLLHRMLLKCLPHTPVSQYWEKTMRGKLSRFYPYGVHCSLTGNRSAARRRMKAQAAAANAAHVEATKEAWIAKDAQRSDNEEEEDDDDDDDDDDDNESESNKSNEKSSSNGGGNEEEVKVEVKSEKNLQEQPAKQEKQESNNETTATTTTATTTLTTTAAADEQKEETTADDDEVVISIESEEAANGASTAGSPAIDLSQELLEQITGLGHDWQWRGAPPECRAALMRALCVMAAGASDNAVRRLVNEKLAAAGATDVEAVAPPKKKPKTTTKKKKKKGGGKKGGAAAAEELGELELDSRLDPDAEESASERDEDWIDPLEDTARAYPVSDLLVDSAGEQVQYWNFSAENRAEPLLFRATAQRLIADDGGGGCPWEQQTWECVADGMDECQAQLTALDDEATALEAAAAADGGGGDDGLAGRRAADLRIVHEYMTGKVLAVVAEREARRQVREARRKTLRKRQGIDQHNILSGAGTRRAAKRTYYELSDD